MSETRWTKGWRYAVRDNGSIRVERGDPENGPHEAWDFYGDEETARKFVAVDDLYEAAALLEAAEDFNANCDECDGEGVPELCPKCFPLFDDARVKRRIALARARGEPLSPPKGTET